MVVTGVAKKARCLVEGCGEITKSNGRCSSHFMIWYHSGQDRQPTKPYARSTEESLLFYIDSKVEGCWEWRGFTTEAGYGSFAGKAAHRLAYETLVGPIPEGHVVRHKCDNPPCINPDHLETGTHADNARDRVERGRSAIGLSVGTSKFSAKEVLEIRSLYRDGLGMRAIGRLFGAHHSTISGIVRGVSYTDVQETPNG